MHVSNFITPVSPKNKLRTPWFEMTHLVRFVVSSAPFYLMDNDVARVTMRMVLLVAVRNSGTKEIHRMHVVYVVKAMKRASLNPPGHLRV